MVYNHSVILDWTWPPLSKFSGSAPDYNGKKLNKSSKTRANKMKTSRFPFVFGDSTVYDYHQKMSNFRRI